MRPVIGLSASLRDDTTEYHTALERFGFAVRPFAHDTGTLPEALTELAGVVLAGGADVVPERYGGTSVTGATYEPERDAFEIALVHALRERDLPVLAICRGLQVANVALGGTLVAHLPDVVRPDAIDHERRSHVPAVRRRVLDDHVVALEPSLLRDVLGEELPTNSRHHQALGRIGDGLRVVGRTRDGVVEAVEATFAPRSFFGVQWHPETSALGDDGPSLRLFAAFREAADGRAREISE